jgi:hypothetical protein
MSALPHYEDDRASSGQERSAWVKPSVASLSAGSAEIGDVTTFDGESNFS